MKHAWLSYAAWVFVLFAIPAGWAAEAGPEAAKEKARERPASPEASARALVHAYLQQARALAPSKERPGSDAALERLKARIEAKRKAWSKRIARDLGTAGLLAGIPSETIIRVRQASGKAAPARASLQENVTLALLLALAERRNPDTRTAFEHLRSVVRHFRQASYLEDLVAQYRSFVRELDTKVGPQSHKEMPSKTFAFPSALALKGQVVDAEAQVARQQYLRALRQALNATARGFFDVQYTTQALRIVKENRVLFAQMESIARAQLRVGKVSQADSLKAQSMLAILDNRIVTLERRRTNAIARVNTLLDLPPESPWGSVREADLRDDALDLKAALTQARKDSQEWRIAQRQVELMAVMLRLAETMVLPRGSKGMSQLAPSVGAEAGPTRQSAAAFPERPMLSQRDAAFGANAAYLDELRVRVKQAKEHFASVRAQTEFQVKNAHFWADVGRRDRKTYEASVVPKVRQAFETLQERYRAAQVPFIEYLDAGRGYLDAQLSSEKARRDFDRGLVNLQNAMGRSAAELLPAARAAPKGGAVKEAPKKKVSPK